MRNKAYTRRSVMAGAAAIVAAPLPNPIMADTPEVHEVEIRSFKFVPKVVQVRVGDTIRWINMDVAPHTATADEFGWNTDELGKSDSAEIVVTEGIETSYFCVFHPHMKGRFEIIE